jgi:hypothetical protein
MLREDILAKAWREVKANAASAGVDGQTIEEIEQRGVQGLLTELAAELREGGTDRTRCGGCVCPNQATGPRACFSATWL